MADAAEADNLQFSCVFLGHVTFACLRALAGQLAERLIQECNALSVVLSY